MTKKFRVTLMKGLSGCSESQRRTVAALGLRKRHHSVVVSDNQANRGQILKIQHMVEVEVQR
jgi:large subunit ribosomal protein L30